MLTQYNICTSIGVGGRVCLPACRPAGSGADERNACRHQRLHRHYRAEPQFRQRAAGRQF
ncbi:hypothetical protein [Sodalis glossinidius]|uniref:hypothetical protein n=1 Tax=Sodalis glossinidius TaxID=63612 RepID=UPI0031203AD6